MKANEFIVEANSDRLASKKLALRQKNTPKIAKAVQQLLSKRIDGIISDAKANNSSIDPARIADIISTTMKKSSKVDLDDPEIAGRMTALLKAAVADPDNISSPQVLSAISNVISKSFELEQSFTDLGNSVLTDIFVPTHDVNGHRIPNPGDYIYSNTNGVWHKWKKNAAGYSVAKPIDDSGEAVIDQLMAKQKVRRLKSALFTKITSIKDQDVYRLRT
jgi:chorismate mutase